MSYGVTDQGFVPKTLSIILDEIDTKLKAQFGNQINTQPQSIFGQFKSIAAEREAGLWEIFEAIYNSPYPDTSSGKSLEDVGAITNITKLPALPSRITGLALFGTLDTLIPLGTIISLSSNPNITFTTDSSITLIAGTDEVQTITFGNVPNDGSFKIILYNETTAAIAHDAVAQDVEDAINDLDRFSGVGVTGNFTSGFVITFAGDDGKQEIELITYTDNTLNLDAAATTITVAETTPGVYQGQVDCTCTENGVLAAPYMTADTIDTPVSGLDRVFNPTDAALGRIEESDSEFRIRRLLLLQSSVGGTLEGIRTALLRLNDDETEDVSLESVRVFENYTDIVDIRGLPGHSIMGVIYQAGGSTDRDQDIAQAIFDSKPAGIQPYGDISKTVTDSQGFDHTIKFSRPDEIDIHLILDLTIDSDIYPDDGDDQLKTLIVTWGNDIGVGNDVIVFPKLISIIDGVDGIIDIVVKIEGVPDGDPPTPPTLDDNVSIDDGTLGDIELSRWDTSRITINHV